MGVPIQDYDRCFQNWIDCLKKCMRAGGVYFDRQRKVNDLTTYIQEERRQVTLFLKRHSHTHIRDIFYRDTSSEFSLFLCPASIDRDRLIVFRLSVCLFVCPQKLLHWP